MTKRSRQVLVFIAITAIGGALTAVEPAWAQFPMVDSTAHKQFLERRRQERRQELRTQEARVDPEIYRIGPGDVLAVSLWGEPEAQFEVDVLPDGNVVIPSIGKIALGDMTLAEADRRIRRQAREYYRRAEVTISLVQIRTFTVHVVGEVVEPGDYVATPADRVSNLVRLAGGVTSWADKKAVEVRHRDGKREPGDLLAYERAGDLEGNPFLRGGDVILVPRLRLSEGTVFVEGNIELPGYYQYYEGETLTEFIDRLRVPLATTDWAYAFLERGSADAPGKPTRIALNITHPSRGGNGLHAIRLQDEDRIFLPRRVNEVYVHGQVKKPGEFPFNANLRAMEYVAMAGKEERAAGANRIIIIRRTGERLRGGDIIVERGDVIEVPVRHFSTLQNVMSIAGPISSIILAVVAVISIQSR